MSVENSLTGKGGKVLVTGGTGFIGSYIIKELVEKNYSVRALRRTGSNLPFFIPTEIFNSIEWIEGDILDLVSLEESMCNIDIVIHSAGMISFHKSDKNQMYQVNIQGTANIVNTMIEKNIPRLIHVSSIAALGRTKLESHVSEEKNWDDDKNNTPYAISKYRAEMEVWRGIGEGLSAVIVNPSTVLGYGDWNNSSCRIFKTIYDEFPWYTTGVNGFVDVQDLARVIVLLMESDIPKERFIVNGDNWNFQQLFNTIADGFHKRHPKHKATPFLGYLAWKMEGIKGFFSGKKPLLTKESARVAQSHTFFSNDKLLAALPGFSFTPLQESIQKACKKYLQTINQA
ncbi:MAG TPA: SDR family NAD(P)-dependent oxidoreductase [Chitinophagaceae bacterium]|jgi:nucleoside-diphosphate-sugar epimerase